MKSKIYIQESKHHGKGVFANQNIKKGELIDTFRGRKVKKDAMHVLWTSDDEGILVENDIKYANHDWIDPNAKINELSLYAIKNIKKGEEILWDYHCGYAFEKDIDLNKPLLDNNGMNPIHYAIMYDHEDVFLNCLKTIKKNKIKLESLEAYIDDDNEYLGTILNFIALFGRLNLLKIYLKEKMPLSLSTTDYSYNILHSCFYYDETKIIDYIFKNCKKEEVEYLLINESYEGETPLDFIGIEQESKYKYICSYLFKGVYSDHDLDLGVTRIFNEDISNYYLADYLLDNSKLKLFKLLSKYNKRVYVNFILRSERARRKYLNYLLDKIKFKKKEIKELDNLKKWWPKLTIRVIKIIEGN